MDANCLTLTDIALPSHSKRTIAFHDGQTITQEHFSTDVCKFSAALQTQPQNHYALYDEASYSFAICLFALLHAGKQVWIPGNNRPATARTLFHHGCRLLGDWPGHEVEKRNKASSVNPNFFIRPLDAQQAKLTLFTSGSSGDPKAIEKTLSQLQREVDTLERQWGTMLGLAAAVATVSHQHIYGLLFRLLWPLAAGRPFHSQQYLSPEPMLKALADSKAYWVASPAQLKRLDEISPWDSLSRLTAIFSSGGPLPDGTAESIVDRSGVQVIEIYGSSETGGIGWRHPALDRYWTPFPGIGLRIDSEECCQLTSPYLPNTRAYQLDDRIVLQDDGRFWLGGRLDRIVKVEEKRLSLEQLENALRQFEWIEQTHCQLVDQGGRERIAAVVVPDGRGWEALQRQGRNTVIRQIRRRLMEQFDTVVLPRKWLFMDALPLTPQGKIDQVLLTQLWALNRTKFPQLLTCRHQGRQVVLEIRVRPDLVYFDGHFPDQPILPGVVQLAWVEGYGKLFFAIDSPFSTMEVIKFRKIIRPETVLTMTLQWKPATGKLYFELVSANDSHSSGRMVYRVHE